MTFEPVLHRLTPNHNITRRRADMGLLPDTWNCGLRMRRECRERFPRHQLQRKPLVSNPGMHHGTCVVHVPWCMSGSLTRGGRGKRTRHSRRMRDPQFYVSGKRPMVHIPRDVLFNAISISKWDVESGNLTFAQTCLSCQEWALLIKS